MKKRPREPKPLHPALASITGPAIIKFLASCNATVRSQSLRLLQSWLAAEPPQLSDSDIKKVWKGLFYCLWHADKTPNQVALIDRYTSLFLSLKPSLQLEFFRGFLVTLRREWPGIDRLRLDKFYLLIRRFVKALFAVFRLRKWELRVLEGYFGVLESDGFLAEDKLRGNGVNYHVVSVFLEELKGVGFPMRKEVVDVVLGPFFTVMMRSQDRILLGKVKSYVFDELVKAGKEMLEKKRMGVEEKDGDVLLGTVSLRMGLSGMFYQVGSSVDCVQGNRKVVLGLHDDFLKLEKELELSGVEIVVPEYSDVVSGGDYEVVPQLIPIDSYTSNGNVESSVGEDDDKRISKKSKKAKKGINGDDKKRKKKKRRDENGVCENKSVVVENGDFVNVNCTENFQSLSDDLENDGNVSALNETVLLNLRKQFEKVVAEANSDSDDDLDFPNAPLISISRGKRKRTKEITNRNGDGGVDDAAKSVKRVRFSMKNNLVWKPQNPLPPESLRLPPSVTPRGSALKKGVPPGPL
ncbi:hypothetical protein BUALT_Bualt16G0102500 [Buddleja alternifolia]|uniref:Ribosomal RNA processing 1 n=1 Tax=Buddleja alternifolia TaxID=168488 RepID=A0AAV6WH39_9LAMI|nr:hypothetical protein BUALT_Bualt16G0102500 [Buddleja alternifolia]